MAKPTRRQKTLLFFVALTVYVVVTGLLIRDRYVDFTNDSTQSEATVKVVKPPKKETVAPPSKKPLPVSALIDVPFMVQAPLANWDAIHEETCEEASLMMVHYFRSREKFGSPSSQDDELKSLVAWETDQGYPYDVTAGQVSKIASSYYSMTTGRVIKNPTSEDLKTELAAGRPVIVPAAGRLLGNPNFTGGGPPYHMLVLKGYDSTGFITNDPGTRRGEGYRYSFETLTQAIHDWSGSTSTITSGAKAVLVFD